MPELPYQAINGSTNLKFYLRPAGTINITAINSSSEHIPFNYMVKDIKLGFGVASNWNSTVSQAIIYVPRDRNYSIMIFPQNSLPVSYNWNNFTANQSYTIGLLSNYNATTHTVSKRFNTTIGLVRVTGYINNSQVMGVEPI